MKILFKNKMEVSIPEPNEEMNPREAYGYADSIIRAVKSLSKDELNLGIIKKERRTGNKGEELIENVKIAEEYRKKGYTDTRIGTEILHKSRSYVGALVRRGFLKAKVR